MLIQEEISLKVQNSFDLKEQSKQLLEIAKTGVEKAILLWRGYASEEDEERAIRAMHRLRHAWTNQQLESLEINHEAQQY